MSYELLQNRIKDDINSTSDSTEVARIRHHKTALNNLVKCDVVKPDDLELALGPDLENTLGKYKSVLEASGKDPRSPLSRVKKLAEYYSNIFDVDYTNMSFSEVLQAAVARKYGAKLWTGPITPRTQAKILAEYVTYRTIAKEIVTDGCKENPKLWESVDLNKPQTLGSASKVVRDYITGESIPSERVPDIRIHFIEKFLHLSPDSLASKIKRKIDHAYRGKQRNELSESQANKRKLKNRTLSSNLQHVCDEYSAYKMNGTQPQIINIPDDLKSSKYYELRAKVQENNKKKDLWTTNAKGKCGSKSGFIRDLLAFQDYCITELNMEFEDIGTVQLTDPILIHNWCIKSGRAKTGASSASRLLNWIYRSAKNQGYLRFCADRGARSMNEFLDDLDYICEEYPNWLEVVKNGIGEKTKGAQKGKANIAFLLKLPFEERKRKVHQASAYLMERAENFQREAHQQIKFAKKSPGPVSEEKRYKSAASNIRRALNYAQAAVVLEASFVNAPRAGNWTMLKYYPSASVQNRSFASLTFLRQRNRYQLYIPLYGTSLIDPEGNESTRYIKNADSKNAVDVDVELPEILTPLIKRFLSIRKDYLELDISRYGNVEASSVEWLMPWRSVRATSSKDPIRLKLRSLFINEESKFGENFEAMTYTAFMKIMPEENQHGINIHAIRHLVAETHLDEYPGDFIGAASKLNDDVEQIIKTYGDKDRSKAMRRVSENYNW